MPSTVNQIPISATPRTTVNQKPYTNLGYAENNRQPSTKYHIPISATPRTTVNQIPSTLNQLKPLIYKLNRFPTCIGKLQFLNFIRSRIPDRRGYSELGL